MLTSFNDQKVTLNPLPVDGGTLSALYNGDNFTDEILIASCGEDITIAFTLASESGTTIKWEKWEVNNPVWKEITDSDGDDHKFSVTFIDGAMVSTHYRVIVNNGTCIDESNQIYVRALPPGEAPTVGVNNNDICLDAEIKLTATSNYTTLVEVIPGSGGGFDQGQLPDGWDVDGEDGGFSSGGSATKPRNWSGKTHNNQDVGEIEYWSNADQVGSYAIAAGNYTITSGGNKYSGERPSTLETPVFNLAGTISPSLEFDQAYNFANDDLAIIEIFVEGAWETLLDLHAVGDGPLNWYDNSTALQRGGLTTSELYEFGNDNTSIPLDAYIGRGDLRIRWSFDGNSANSAWAMDNITVNKLAIVETEVEWTDGIGDPEEPVLVPGETGQTSVEYNFTPDAPGKHQYGATALINDCRSYDELGTGLVDVYVSLAYAGEDKEYADDECGQNTVQLNAYDNRKTATENAAKGTFDIPDGCLNCDDEGTMNGEAWTNGKMKGGMWTISPVNGCGLGSVSDPLDPDAIFTGDTGEYTLTWTVGVLVDNSGNVTMENVLCSDDITIIITNCDTVDFDGDNDYVDFDDDNYDLASAFSLEVWVKPTDLSGGDKTIFSKRDGDVSGKGYDLSVDSAGTVSFNWDESGNVSSPYNIGIDRWYHIAVTHTGSVYELYIDGILVDFQGGGSPTANDYKCILGAMDQDGNPPNKPINYFNGWIDEVRIWNKALSVEHIRQMMNQQIIKNVDAVRGEVIPMDIIGLDVDGDGSDDNELIWDDDLVGYYRMGQFACGYLLPYNSIGANGKLKNITTPETQNAPLPYTSRANSSWTTDTTWTEYLVWDPPNSNGVDGSPIDWNIVETSHDISSGAKNITLLGLIVELGELTIADPGDALDEYNGGQGLWITHYLELDGSIDLVGESQLVQKRYTTTQFSESILDEDSGGSLERHQQGTQSSFNYNYWSSTVGPISGNTVTRGTGVSSMNSPYTISSILMDGTVSSSPNGSGVISYNWAYAWADQVRQSPIRLSDYWFWKFNGPAGEYGAWQHVGSYGQMLAGEGYTMKGTSGTAAISDRQNYVFKGRPNNGTINSLTISEGTNRLVGNPYPSSLDADEFIKDNTKDGLGRNTVNVFNGTLYFWDHFSGHTHILASYVGGYATYTLIGGVRAISNDYRINATGSQGTKTPGQFIPVNQGFFLNAAIDPSLGTVEGGAILFKNSQREFQPEDGVNSLFIKNANSKDEYVEASENAKEEEDLRPRIRLQYDSPLGYHRSILVGVDPDASDQFDLGYDAPLNETNEEDMYWYFAENHFSIQGIAQFTPEKELPLGIRVKEQGTITIKIEALENIPSELELYIKDNDNDGETYDIKNSSGFEIDLEPGEYKDRFSLVFQSRLDKLDEIAKIEDGVVIYMNNTDEQIVIQKTAELDFVQATLYNYLGQIIKSWDQGMDVRKLMLPVNQVSTGVYIISLQTEQGIVSKKILIE